MRRKSFILFAVIAILYCVCMVGYSTWIITTETDITPSYSGQAEVNRLNYDKQTTVYDGKRVNDDINNSYRDIEFPVEMYDTIRDYYNSDYEYYQNNVLLVDDEETVNIDESKPRDAGLYTVKVKPKTDDGVYEEIVIQLTVKPLLIELEYGYKDSNGDSYPEGETSDITKVYNGLETTPLVRVSNLMSDENGVEDTCDLTFSWGDSAPSIRNYSENPYKYKVSSCSNPNYTLVDGENKTNVDFSFKIEKLIIELSWDTNHFVYDGSEQAPIASASNMIEGDDLSITVNGDMKDANAVYNTTTLMSGFDKYTANAVSLSGEDSINYELPDDCSKDFYISQKLLEVKAEPYAIDYGKPAKADSDVNIIWSGFVSESDKANYISSANVTFTYTYDQAIKENRKVGTYDISPSVESSNTNYYVDEIDSVLTVKAISASYIWSNTSTLIYNGSPQKPNANVNLAYSDDDVSASVSGEKTDSHIKASVNNYEAFVSGLSGSDAQNYVLDSNIASYKTTFIINQRDISNINVVLTDDEVSEQKFVYRFSQIKPTATCTDMVGENNIFDLESDASVSYGDNRNAGTGTVTLNGCGNYKGTKVESFDIAKRKLTITWDSSPIENDLSMYVIAYSSSSVSPSFKIGNIASGETSIPTLNTAGAATDANVDSGFSGVNGIDPYTFQILNVNNNSNNYELLTDYSCVFYIRQHMATLNVSQDSSSAGIDVNSWASSSAQYSYNKYRLNSLPTFSFTYNGASQYPYFAVSNLLGGDESSVSTENDNNYIDANDIYNVLIKTLKISNKNYEVPALEINIPFVINPKVIEIDWDKTGGYDTTYDGLARSFTLFPKDESICERDKANSFEISTVLFENDVRADVIKNANADLSGAKLATNLRYEIMASAILENDVLSNNYILADSGITKEFIIRQKDLTITANDYDITYGEDTRVDSNANATYVGFVNGESYDSGSDLKNNLVYTYTYDKASRETRKVGEYTISIYGYTSNNYAITYVNGKLDVLQLEVDIRWEDLESTYAGLNSTYKPNAYVNNKPYADDVVNINVSGEQTHANVLYGSTISNIQYINANKYEALADSLFGDQSGNYKLSSDNSNKTEEFIIKQYLLNVRAIDHYITYGDYLPNRDKNYLDISDFAGSDNLDTLNGVIVFTDIYDRTKIECRSVGNYKVTPKIETLNTDYHIEYEDGNLEVKQKVIGISWTNLSHVYDGKAYLPKANATDLVSDYNDIVNISLSGEQTNANAYYTSDVLFGTKYVASAISLDNRNYKLPSDNTSEFIIKQAPLSISVIPFEVTYGDEIIFSVNNLDADGFVNGESFDVLSGTLSYVTSYDTSNVNKRSVGSYDIKACGYGTLGNYEITYVDSVFALIQREVTVKTIKLDTVYNGLSQVPSNVTFSNVVYDDVLSPVFDVIGYNNAGTYEIKLIALAGAKCSNYKITNVTYDNFVINKAPLKVVLSDKTITYGDSEPEYSELVSFEGFVNGETKSVLNLVSDAYSEYDTSNVSKRNAGSYVINSPVYESANYEISYNNSTLTVNKKIISVSLSSENSSSYYNGSVQIPNFSIEGFAYNDNIETIKNSLEFSKELKNAGTYNNVSLTIDHTNYTFTDTNVNYTILPAEIGFSWTISDMVYKGSAYTLSDVISASVSSGEVYGSDQLGLSISIENGSALVNAGSYKALASISNSNYKIVSGSEHEFSIAKKELVVEWSDENSFVYNGNYQYINASLDGVIANDVVNINYGELSSVNVGTYVRIAKSVDNSNYCISESSCTFNITKAPINITWSIGEYEFDGTIKTLSNPISIDSSSVIYNNVLSNSNDVINLSYSSNKELLEAGTYTISASIDNNNYYIKNNQTSELVIKPKLISVSATVGSLTYNGSLQNISASNLSVSGAVSGFDPLVTVSGQGTNAGEYDASISVGSNNYYLEYKDGEYIREEIIKFTIAKAILHVSFTDIVYTGSSITSDIFKKHVIIQGVYNDDDLQLSFADTAFSYDVGTYEVSVSTGNPNYAFELIGIEYNYTMVSYRIVPKTITISWDSNESFEYAKVTKQKYAIASAEAAQADIRYAYEVLVDGEYVSSTTSINAGSYRVRAYLDSESNYELSGDNYTNTYVINTKGVDITWNDVNHVFDGNKYSVPVSKLNVIGQISGDDLGLSISGSGVEVGTYAASASVTNTNYHISSGDSHLFEISPKVIEVDYVFNKLTYTGKAQSVSSSSITSNDVISGYDALFSVSGSGTNAGVHSAVISIGSKNYVFTDGSKQLNVSFTIDKAPLTFALIESRFEYSSYIPTLQASVSGEVNGETVSLTVTGEEAKNVGTYEATASINDTNYYLVNSIANYVIYPKVISIVMEDLVYNGSTQDARISEVYGELSSGDANVIVSGSGKDANVYNANLTIQNTNYAFSVNENSYTYENTAEFVIKPKEVRAEWENISEFEYTGNFIKPNVIVNESDICDGDTVEAKTFAFSKFDGENYVSTNDYRNVGSYKVEVTSWSNDNYSVSCDAKEFSITPREITVSFDDLSQAWTGNELAPTIEFVGATKPEEITYMLLFNGNEASGVKDVGTYSVQVVLTNANYVIINTYTCTFDIITAPCPDAWMPVINTIESRDTVKLKDIDLSVFKASDGNSYGTLTWISDDDQNPDNLLSRGTNSYSALFTPTDSNYSAFTIVIKIHAKHVVKVGFELVQSTFEFDNTEKSLTYNVSTNDSSIIDLSSIATLTWSYDDRINAGSHKVTLSVSDIKEFDEYIYEFDNTSANSTLVINPKKVSINSINSTEYDALAKTPEVSLNGVIEGDNCAFTKEWNVSELKNAGTYTVTVTLDDNNYRFENDSNKATASYEITKKEISVEVQFNELVYNGTSQSPEIKSSTFNGVCDGDTVELEVGGSGKNAATYNATVTILNSNYVLADNKVSFEKEFTIAKKELTVNWGALEFTYDGASHNVSPTLEGVCIGDTVNVTVTSDAHVFVSEYIATITIDDDNYYLNEDRKAFNIVPRTLNISISDLTYNAKVQDITEYTSDKIGDDDLGLSITHSGVNVGVHNATLTITNNNYVLASKTVEFNIIARSVGLEWTDLDKEYTGQALNPDITLSNVIEGDTCGYSFTYKIGEEVVDARDAGTYIVTVELLNNNYVFEDEAITSKNFVINPKVVSVEWGTMEGDYEASKAHTPNIIVSGLTVNDYVITYTNSNDETIANMINAGTYTVTVTLTNSNYTFSEGMEVTNNYVINKVDYPTNLLPIVEGLVGYDHLTLSSVVFGEYDAGTYTWVDGSIQLSTSVSTYEALFTPADSNNYNSIRVNVSVAVKHVNNITVTLFGESSVTFDGNKHTLSYNVSGLPENVKLEDIATITWAYGSEKLSDGFINVNSGNTTVTLTVVINEDVKDIYVLNNSTITGQLEVTPRAVTIDDIDSVEYKGEAYAEPNIVLNNVVDNYPCAYSVSWDNSVFKNAGTYTATVTLGDNSNYTFVSDGTMTNKASVEFVITKKLVTFAWNESTEYSYIGEKQFRDAIVKGTYGEDKVTINYTINGDSIYVGNYSVTASINDGNYYAISETVDYSITKAEITVTWPDGVSYTYNGENRTPVATFSGVFGDDKVNYTYVYKLGNDEVSEYKNVGTYTVSVSGCDNDNYVVKENSCEYDINKAKLTITWDDFDLTYKASEYTIDSTYVNISGYVNGEKDLVSVSADRIVLEAGQYTATATINSSNYEFDGDSTKAFEVKKASITVTWPNSASYEYNGNDQSPEATFSGAYEELVYTYVYKLGNSVVSEHKNAGTYTVSVTGVNSNNYVVLDNSCEFTITKIIIDAEVEDLVYTGSAISPSKANIVVLEGSTLYDSFELSVESEANVNVGTYDAKVTIPNSNYAFEGDVSYKICQYEITPMIISAKWNIPAMTYKGSAYSIIDSYVELKDANGNVISAETLARVVSGTGTNVGAYDATVTITNNNYAFGINDGAYVRTATTQFEISKLEVKVEISNNRLPWTGSALAPTVVVSSNVEGINYTLAASGYKVEYSSDSSTWLSSVSEVGSYTVRVSLTEESLANMSMVASTFTFEIEKATLKNLPTNVSVTAYEGTKLSDIDLSTYNTSDATLVWDNSDYVLGNVSGVYQIPATFKANDSVHYKDSSINISVTVVNYTYITISLNSNGFIYDGEAKSLSYTVSGLPGNVKLEDIATITWTNNSLSEVGNVTVTLTVTLTNKAYKINNNDSATLTATLTINPCPVTITLDNTISKKWDGNAYVPEVTLSKEVSYSITYKLINGENETSVTEAREVGKYNITVNITNSNYTGTATKSFEITKATPVYSISSFEAKVGSTLSNVALPDNFSWDTDKINGGLDYVIQSGSNHLYVIYTPSDTDHYEVVYGIEIEVVGISSISVFVELYYSIDGINPIMDNTYGNATDGFEAVYNGKAHYVIPYIYYMDGENKVKVDLSEFSVSYGYNGNFTQSVNPGFSDVNTVETSKFEILIQLTSASQSYSLNCAYSNCEIFDDGDLYISSSLLVQPLIIDPNDLVINLTHNRELIYDGMKHEPTVEVLYNGSVLDKELYSITYANNINASSISYGYAQVVIRGTDSYWFGTDNYKIVEFSIAKANVTVNEWPVVLHPTKDESVLQEGDAGRLSDTGNASVPGTFDFTLPAGTTSAKFTAGTATTRNVTVSLTFTPTDYRNYNSVSSTASFTLEAVCYIGNTYYGTIEAALNTAISGQTVFVIEGANPTIRSSVEIKSGVTLCIPYSGTTYNGRQSGKESDGSWKEDSRNLDGGSSDFADSNATRVAKYRKTYVNIADSVELTVNGTLQIGGILGVETQTLNGATSGYYSEIILGNDSKITSNGNIYCLGYIKEASSNNGSIVEAKSGTIYMPFAIHDYRGGRATIGAYYGSGSLLGGIQNNTPNITPFNVYSMPNIQSLLIINYGANLVGYADLYTDAISVSFISLDAQHNTTDVNVIGSENSIINLTTSNSRIEIKYNAADCRYTNKSLDRTTLSIYGGAKTGTLSLSVTVAIISATVTTAETLFPIPWIYDINLHDGDYVIENKMKFLTGSSLTVHEDANLSVNADTIFYSSFTDVTYGGSVYPQKDAAYITNNGTLNISAPFGGTIKTTCDTAVLNINNISDITSIEGHGGGSGLDVTFTQTSSITESINGPMVNTLARL